MNYWQGYSARKDCVRRYYPNADQDYCNRPVAGLRPESRTGLVIASLLVGFMGGAALSIFVLGVSQ